MTMQTIAVHLPDGAIREVPSGTTPLEIANSISPRLAAACVVARLTPVAATAAKDSESDGEPAAEAAMYATEDASAPRLVDLATPLTADTRLELVTEKDPEALKVVRHSAAHVLATAVLELFPETKLGHGPATDPGFFYDFYRVKPFTPEDLALIEARMAEVIARDEQFVRDFEPREQALAEFERDGDFMKTHFVTKFTAPGDEVSFYRNGKFMDFCRGPHVPSTGRVKAVKLTTLAGAYWLGDEKNPQLQRIHGTAFFSKKDLDAHFARLEEAAKRDHRLLGKQLDLFSIQELAGAGLIFWHPKGAMIRKIMEDWMREECLRRGYSLVYTPHVARVNLWQTSGHEGFYAQNMFTPMELDDANYRMKPMNCPFHILIYKNSPKSYRDLPVRLAELGNVYRYERSGTMHGLLRVRGFTQDDAHIFCMPEPDRGRSRSLHRLCRGRADHLWLSRVQGRTLHLGSQRPRTLCRLGRKLEGGRRVLEDGRSIARASPTRSFPAKQPSMDPRSTSNSSMCWAVCGSFRPCNSTSICRRASRWSTWAKTASSISR